jgi:spermidine synthase
MALPWTTLESIDTKDGALELRRRGERDFLITIAGRVLMSSMAHRSEDALARLACAGLKGQSSAKVLVSGLGMGYTLRAALDALAEDAVVTVAELNPVVVAWCKGALGALTQAASSDARVDVQVADVAQVIFGRAKAAENQKFDAIILDMYEGPQTRVHPNDPLYGPRAVQRARAALAAGGRFAIWCEARSTGFEKNLTASEFSFKLERVGKGGRLHYVYLACPSEPKMKGARSGL